MSHISDSSVIPFEGGIKGKIVSDDELSSSYEGFKNELKADVEKHFEEYSIIQECYSEQLESLENSYKDELVKIRELFANMGKDFDQYKNNIQKLIESQIHDETKNVTKVHNELINRISQIEQNIAIINPDTLENDVKKVRQDVIEGIKILGSRVSTAINEMEKRFNDFTEQLNNVSTTENLKKDENVDKGVEENVEEKKSDVLFGSIKESKLIIEDQYEVISQNSLSKLANIFKKQTQGIKNIIEEQQSKVNNFEHLIKIYDDENTKLYELLSRKTKINFIISMSGISILAALLIISYFI